MAERDRLRGESYHRGESRGELPPYVKAARFTGEQLAGLAYSQAQDAVYASPQIDLSVYRLIFQQVYHVALLGQTPPEHLRRQLQEILAIGHPADLPTEVLIPLAERRAQQIRHGSWVEGHYRPGRRL